MAPECFDVYNTTITAKAVSQERQWVLAGGPCGFAISRVSPRHGNRAAES